jgi:hypothetical protein
VSELHFPWSSLIVHRLSVMQAFWRARKRSSITKFPLSALAASASISRPSVRFRALIHIGEKNSRTKRSQTIPTPPQALVLCP